MTDLDQGGGPGIAQNFYFGPSLGWETDLLESSTGGVASGSNASTSGSIAAGNQVLSLSNATDFVNGQYVRINHAGPAFSLTAPSSGSVTPQGTPGGTTYTYTLAALDESGGVGQSITNITTATGNATLSRTNFNRISWTNGTGIITAVYGRTAGSLKLMGIVRGATSFDDIGLNQDNFYRPDFIPQAPQTSASLAQWLISQIAGGGGTNTLTLANNATTAVSNGAVLHDDTIPIQAALNALPDIGGVVDLNSGTYNTTSSLSFGNGNGVTASTKNGMRLRGPGGRGGVNAEVVGNLGSTIIQYNGYSLCILVNGPINGWGLENITLSCANGSSTGVGLNLNTAWFGQTRGLLVAGFGQIGINSELSSTSHAGALNSFQDTVIYMPPNAAFAFGVRYNGTVSTDIFDDTWRGLEIIPNQPDQVGISLGSSDSNTFYDVQINPTTPACTAIRYDYTIAGASHGWPSATFYNLEVYGNAITNVGSPPALAFPANRIWNFSVGNGAAVPFLPNVQVMDFPRALDRTFAQLPAADNNSKGTMFIVTNSSTATPGAIIAGGGANTVLAISKGGNWICVV